jgi:hypothetical protein
MFLCTAGHSHNARHAATAAGDCGQRPSHPHPAAHGPRGGRASQQLASQHVPLTRAASAVGRPWFQLESGELKLAVLQWDGLVCHIVVDSSIYRALRVGCMMACRERTCSSEPKLFAQLTAVRPCYRHCHVKVLHLLDLLLVMLHSATDLTA